MVDNINIPMDVTNILKIDYKPEPLRRFLIDLLLRIDALEKQVRALEEQVNNGST